MSEIFSDLIMETNLFAAKEFREISSGFAVAAFEFSNEFWVHPRCIQNESLQQRNLRPRATFCNPRKAFQCYHSRTSSISMSVMRSGDSLTSPPKKNPLTQPFARLYNISRRSSRQRPKAPSEGRSGDAFSQRLGSRYAHCGGKTYIALSLPNLSSELDGCQQQSL